MQLDPATLASIVEPLEFLAVTIAVVILAYLALEHKDIVYAAFFFGLMAALVSGYFLFLEAPFVAGMQIAVYTGGISALIVFGVLLLPRAQDSSLETFASPEKRKMGMLIAAAVTSLSAALALTFPGVWVDTPVIEITDPLTRPDPSFWLEELAVWLWQDHGILIQIVGLIILTTLVGAIAIMRMEKAERMKPLKSDFGIEVMDLEDHEETPETTSETTEVDEQ
jgi:NADH:ubiquinone oxidoreductase subunit 6 (subunit J)